MNLLKQIFYFAISKLPVAWDADKLAAPTKDVAKALLAKVYLTMATYPLNDPANYNKGQGYAKPGYRCRQFTVFVPDVDDVFKWRITMV